MITAMSAIANDGVLLKPHIVKAIYNADGTVYQQMEREEVRRCIDSDVDKTLKSVLEQVVSTGGGSKASIEGYHIAGKTGTAQKIDMVNGGYCQDIISLHFVVLDQWKTLNSQCL